MSQAMDYVEDLQESDDSDPETPDTTPASKSPSGPSGPSSGTITNFSLKTCTSALYKVSNASTSVSYTHLTLPTTPYV